MLVFNSGCHTTASWNRTPTCFVSCSLYCQCFVGPAFFGCLRLLFGATTEQTKAEPNKEITVWRSGLHSQLLDSLLDLSSEGTTTPTSLPTSVALSAAASAPALMLLAADCAPSETAAAALCASSLGLKKYHAPRAMAPAPITYTGVSGQRCYRSSPHCLASWEGARRQRGHRRGEGQCCSGGRGGGRCGWCGAW